MTVPTSHGQGGLDAAENLTAWRTRYPAASGALDELAASALRAGCTTAAVWGSVALGDYVPGLSDIDLFLVGGPADGPAASSLRRQLAARADLGFEVLSLSLEHLTASAPVARRGLDPGQPYQLHGLDLIQLREYAVVVAGSNVLKRLRPLNLAAECQQALDHVLDTMVPRALAAARDRRSPRQGVEACMAVCFVLVRCLYALHEGRVGAKSGAAAWAAAHFRRDPPSPALGRAAQCLLDCRRTGKASAAEVVGDLEFFAAVAGEAREVVCRWREHA